MVFVGSFIGRKIMGRAGGTQAMEKFMLDAVPKITAKALINLTPAKRQEVLASWRAMLDGLDEQYGTVTANGVDPAG